MLRAIAAPLTEYFKERSGLPLRGYAAKPILIAFPEKWNPAGDPKDALRKLLGHQKPIL